MDNKRKPLPKGISLYSLPPFGNGVFTITTINGTRHELDYDNQTITRFPTPGREWVDWKGTIHEDRLPFYYTWIDNIKVGESFTAKSIRGDFRMSSEIVSIEINLEDE